VITPEARNRHGATGIAADRPEVTVSNEVSEVLCPMCLSRLERNDSAYWRWDGSNYVELQIPPGATVAQRAYQMQGAMIRCPDPLKSLEEHYLPAGYANYGRPVVIGFIGATTSGKTHLLSAMVGAIEGQELSDFNITSRPLDQRLHHRFLEDNVRPLLDKQTVLPATPEKIITFADALLMGSEDGPQRPVALFDVAGGDLSRQLTSEQGAKRFLQIADGFVFVVDSVRLGQTRTGDDTFNTLLDLLRSVNRLRSVSAAVVLNKADLRRFDDPVTRWLRTDLAGLDPHLIREESADVFAYLESFESRAWVEPYRACAKGTLHVASATGCSAEAGPGSAYSRGVKPRRVLGPLVALLAMTGVLDDQRARQVGA
jgi:hypothetical protein